jgi:hypothetical protein
MKAVITATSANEINIPKIFSRMSQSKKAVCRIVRASPQ